VKTVCMLMVAAVFAQPVTAKDIAVKMLNTGKEGTMVFEPAFIKAMPGDRVIFAATDPGHNGQTIAGMLPEGETEQKGAIGKDFVLTVKTPGIYGVKCLPHYSMGMVAVVQVGKGPSANLAAAQMTKMPPLAKKRMTVYLADAK